MNISYSAVERVIFVVILAWAVNTNAQTPIGINKFLSADEYQKYQKASQLIGKGTDIINEADTTALYKGSSKQALRESGLKKEQAGYLLNDGYSLKIRVLKEHLNSFLSSSNGDMGKKEKATILASSINQNNRKSKKLYRKSRNTSKLKNTIKFQEEAQKIQAATISDAEKVLVGLYRPAPKHDNTKKVAKTSTADKKQTKTESINQAQAIEEKTSVTVPRQPEINTTKPTVAAETKKKLSTAKPVPANKDVYFTIQIIADKTRISGSRLNMVYNGNRKIIEHEGGGWYRYSVGRFGSYSEAASVMKSEGIKGYVVAYNGNKRITTSEAKILLGGTR
ncbi:MAG: hypothetical protein GXO47_11675 [Chlorobi bacterium]|nr:hypothetical protein [Chlorobiota bacterium]